MRAHALCAGLVVSLLPLHAIAKDVAGVAFPPTVEAAGKVLKLNGAGVRTRFFIKVYAIGLYLERPGSDAQAILAADQVRRAQLHMLRSVDGKEMAEAIGDAFSANAGSAAGQLQDRLTRFKAMFPNARAGEVIALTYVPGVGTTVGAAGRDLGTVEGKDFADVLFSAWIGAHPVDESLKGALLSGP